jgi:hypothetical protein
VTLDRLLSLIFRFSCLKWGNVVPIT